MLFANGKVIILNAPIELMSNVQIFPIIIEFKLPTEKKGIIINTSSLFLIIFLQGAKNY